MKKTLLTFALLAGLSVSAEAQNAVSQNYTHTFTTKVFSTNPGSAALGNDDTAAPLKTADWALDATVQQADKDMYFGSADAAKGIQLGSGKASVKTMTLKTSDIPGEISNVTVNTSGAKDIAATVSISVGGTAFVYGTDASSATLTDTAAEYSFSGNGEGEIVISYANTSAKALYIKCISVTYAVAEDPDKPTPVLAWSDAPETLNVGEEVKIEDIFTVTPAEAAKYVAFSSSDPSVATCTDGFVSAKKRGTTTISASFASVEGYNDAQSVSFDLTVLNPDATVKVYKPLLSLEGLGENTEILIASADGKCVLSTNQADSNRRGVNVTPGEDGTISVYSDDDQIAVVTLGKSTIVKDEETVDCYTFFVTNGESTGYLYAASSDKNYLKTEAELDDNAKAEIVISEVTPEVDAEEAGEDTEEPTVTYITSVKFLGANTRNVLQYNPNNNSPIFSCYGSASQTGVQLYYYEAEPVVKETVTLAWSSEEAMADIDNLDEFAAPTLTVTPEAVASEVTYSSSDETVATIDAEGKLTILAKGVTTITASFAGNDNYEAAASVSYTLTVDKQHGISEIGGNISEAEYYDLQGRRVVNPEKGIYIKREGTTVTKVIL